MERFTLSQQNYTEIVQAHCLPGWAFCLQVCLTHQYELAHRELKLLKQRPVLGSVLISLHNRLLRINLLANLTHLVHLKHMFLCCLCLNFPLKILLYDIKVKEKGRVWECKNLELLVLCFSCNFFLMTVIRNYF